MDTFSDHDLHHVARRRALQEYVADRTRKSSFVAALDRRYAGMGAASDEYRAVDRLRPESPEVE